MQGIIEAIRTCSKCGLRDKVCESYGKKDTYNTFCFYYSEADIKAAPFIMIMQNPGQSNDYAATEENNELLKATANNFVDINKKYLLKWLRGKNKTFITSFINKLNSHGLIKYKYAEDENFESNFLHDFLFTDVVKCRTTTSNTNDFVDICFENYLLKELKEFGSNKLIFVFGTRAWKAIYNSHEFVDKATSSKDNKMNNVSQAHGFLFPSKMINSYFIPLSHFSQTQFNKFLHNSYFDYLEDGLKKYSQISKMN